MNPIENARKLRPYVVKAAQSLDDKDATEAPKWNLSVVAIIVTVLFAIYFFVPTNLF